MLMSLQRPTPENSQLARIGDIMLNVNEQVENGEQLTHTMRFDL